jgi:polar amino acid transport system substrate-binding protein
MVPSRALVAELAPTGTLRAAINFDNPVLAAKDPATGAPGGISVDLSHELARRLGVPIEFVPYHAAGKVVEGLKSGSWDVCYLAIDPVRARDISFTPPYVVIEGVYLVPEDSPLRANADVDRPDVRIAVCTGSAYDLFLSRELKRASIHRAATAAAATELFLAQKLDAVAGVRPHLEADAKRIPRVRLLPGRFMAINQAMGTPRGRAEAAAYLHDFIEEMKASGFVADAFARNRIEGASIAPPAMAQ